MSTEDSDITSDVSKTFMTEDYNVSSYALFSYISRGEYNSPGFGTNKDTTEVNDEVFQLLSSTLDSIQVKQLEHFLTGRLKKGAVYLQNGNFFEMDFTTSKKNPTSFDTCFYIFLPLESHKQLVVCLLAATETNLETFRIELTSFCKVLVSNISLNEDLELPEILLKLSSWNDACVNCASRVINALGSDISCLLQLAQENGKVLALEDVDVSLVDDVRRFVSACLVADCLNVDSAKVSQATLASGNSPGKLHISGIVSNPFCIEWGKLLCDHSRDTEPWKLRRVLEAFKLKTIKDMNILKRLLKQSEMDHYSIYRTYSFLCNSGNGDILLRQAKREQGSAADVITLLGQHMTGHFFDIRHSPLTEQ